MLAERPSELHKFYLNEASFTHCSSHEVSLNNYLAILFIEIISFNCYYYLILIYFLIISII
jgi:hypothetical protein